MKAVCSLPALLVPCVLKSSTSRPPSRAGLSAHRYFPNAETLLLPREVRTEKSLPALRKQRVNRIPRKKSFPKTCVAATRPYAQPPSEPRCASAPLRRWVLRPLVATRSNCRKLRPSEERAARRVTAAGSSEQAWKTRHTKIVLLSSATLH